MRLRKEVIVLGAAALLNDASSDMIFPLLPLFLTTLGASASIIGIIEGTASAAAAALKYWSGKRSDRHPDRKPYIVGGYALAAVSRIAIPFAQIWSIVLAARVADRVGKGIRTAPRDALICDVTDERDRGRAFGFHRAMDHAGAVIGPLAAAGLLAAGWSLRSIFVAAIFPTALAVVLLVGALRGTRAAPVVEETPESGESKRPARLRRFLAPVALFSLANSTDAFLLLQASKAGVATAFLPLIWALHHAVKVALSTWAGSLSDRWGRSFLLIAGWTLYAAVYLAFPFLRSETAFVIVFAIYAIPFALTEGAERAMIGRLAAAQERGAAFGAFALVQGVCVLAGTVAFGFAYDLGGPIFAFHAAAGLAVAAAVTIFAMHEELENAG
jgi:MFS family permease